MVYRTFLEESCTIAQNLPEGGGYLARSQFKLSQVLQMMNDGERSRACREAADALRYKLSGTKVDTDITEAFFVKLVPWMLW